MLYLFVFISTIVFLAILSSFIEFINKNRKFNLEYTSTVDKGRILNFQDGKSKTQYKPV